MKRYSMKQVVVLLSILLFAGTAFSADKVETEKLVTESASVVQGFAADPNLNWFREKVKDAKALLIIPQSLKGAFLVGGSGGTGVLVAHDAGSGEWGYPAFYTIGAVSVGLQIGAEASEIILMIMSERGMEKFLTSSLKLGADATVAAGPVGGGASAKTADVISYSRSKGAFVGASLDGAVVKTRDALNKAYYGKELSPTDIIIRKSVSNPQADGLRKAIAEVSDK
jgi:lipid-binding SYLF domain-containing protein